MPKSTIRIAAELTLLGLLAGAAAYGVGLFDTNGALPDYVPRGMTDPGYGYERTE